MASVLEAGARLSMTAGAAGRWTWTLGVVTGSTTGSLPGFRLTYTSSVPISVTLWRSGPLFSFRRICPAKKPSICKVDAILLSDSIFTW